MLVGPVALCAFCVEPRLAPPVCKLQPAGLALDTLPVAASVLIGEPTFAAVFLPLAILTERADAPRGIALAAATVLWASAATMLDRDPSHILTLAALNTLISALDLRLGAEADEMAARRDGGDASDEAERTRRDFDDRLGGGRK